MSPAARFGFAVDWSEHVVGGAAIDAFGVAIRDEDLAACGEADAILLGAVGGPKWSDPGATVRPEQALFALRGGLGLYANLRPVTRPAGARRVVAAPPRAPRRGRHAHRPRADRRDLLRRPDRGVGRAGRPDRARHAALRRARDRPDRPPGVRAGADAGAASSPRSTRPTCSRRHGCGAGSTDEIAVEYPDVRLNHQLVDSCAMLLIRRPADFDVIVTENLFGDILSDEAAVLAGSLGVLPSASLGERRTEHGQFGLYEPIHGSAPDIAGRDIANPIGTILSAAMLLRTSLGRADAAEAIEAAVGRALDDGWRTADLADPGRPGRRPGRRRHDRRSRPRWSRPSRPVRAAGADRHAWGPHDRRPGRPLRHDPARRDAGREHHALARRQAARRADARRVRDAVHRGRLAGLQPQGHRVLRGRPDDALGARQAGRLRVDPPPLERARRRPEPARAGRRRDPGRDDLREVLAAPRRRGPRRHAGREPRHDRRLGRLRRRPRPRGDLRRRAFLRRLPRRSRLRPVHAARRSPGRCPDAGPVRHERRHADRRAGHDHRRRADRARGRRRRAAGHLGDPHPQRRRPRGRQLDGRGGGRDPPRPGHDQRLRRAGRQREHGQHPGQPRAQDAARAGPGRWRRPVRPDRPVALGRGDRQHQPRTTTSRTSGARRSRTRAASTARRSPRSSGATSTSTRRPSATPGGWSSPSWAAGPTSRSVPSSSARSSMASSTRASCRS